VSAENVELVKEIFARWRSGDSAFDAFDPNVEWDARHFPDGELFHGHEGMNRFVRMWIGTWEDYEIEVEELFDAGDSVVAFTRERGHGKGSAAPMEIAAAMVITLRDGAVVRWRAFFDRSEAFRAAAIDPP
jgi:ketosteroid isomerase-like protein